MLRLLTFVGVAFLAGASGLTARQEPQFHGGTNTVSIYATVLDQNARLVTSLGRGDFDVYDNGVKQDVTVFASDLQPITIVVMLDRSGSMKSNFNRVRDAAEVFVSDLLPDDRARIGSFSDRIEIDPATFTGDQAELIRILHEDLVDAGMTPLWNATSLAMDALRHEEGRRVVLVFTDGKDTPGLGPNVSFEEVRSRSMSEEVMVYGIGFSEVCEPDDDGRRRWIPSSGRGGGVWYQRGPGRGRLPGGGSGGRLPGGTGRGRPGVPLPGLPLPGPSIPGVPVVPPVIGVTHGWTNGSCADAGPDPELRELAAEGGGGYFELRAGDDLRSTFSRVADELHHQYLLAFTATRLDNTVHRLDVRVRRPGLTVRARRTYLAN
jgi:VWFA-related protein